jgi:hypothetical protein
MILTELDIELISDSLANFHDWAVSDLRLEFIHNLKDNKIPLPERTMEMIFDNFMSLDPQERFKRGFNHKKFTTELLKAYPH